MLYEGRKICELFTIKNHQKRLASFLIKDRILFAIASGDRTAIKWTANANFGPGAGLSWEGIDVFEVNSAGKITKVFSYRYESVFAN